MPFLLLEASDLVAAMTTYHDHVLIATQRGYLYKMMYDGYQYSVQRL